MHCGSDITLDVLAAITLFPFLVKDRVREGEREREVGRGGWKMKQDEDESRSGL